MNELISAVDITARNYLSYFVLNKQNNNNNNHYFLVEKSPTLYGKKDYLKYPIY